MRKGICVKSFLLKALQRQATRCHWPNTILCSNVKTTGIPHTSFSLKKWGWLKILAYFYPSEPYFFLKKSRVESIFWLVFSLSSRKRTIKKFSLKELHVGLKTATGQGAQILPHNRGSCFRVLLDEQNEWDKWFISLILHRGLSFCWLNKPLLSFHFGWRKGKCHRKRPYFHGLIIMRIKRFFKLKAEEVSARRYFRCQRLLISFTDRIRKAAVKGLFRFSSSVGCKGLTDTQQWFHKAEKE